MPSLAEYDDKEEVTETYLDCIHDSGSTGEVKLPSLKALDADDNDRFNGQTIGVRRNGMRFQIGTWTMKWMTLLLRGAPGM